MSCRTCGVLPSSSGICILSMVLVVSLSSERRFSHLWLRGVGNGGRAQEQVLQSRRGGEGLGGSQSCVWENLLVGSMEY